MNTHTPGPWIVTPRGYILGKFKPTKPDGGYHAVCQVEMNPSDGSGPANARLIAAAPNLLEACNTARKDYDNINYPTEEHKRVMAVLDAAIAKANGGAVSG